MKKTTMKITRINPTKHITPTTTKKIVADKSRPNLVLKGNTTLNLGEISKLTTHNVSFTLTNPFDVEVIITNIRASCQSCTTLTNNPLTDRTVSGEQCKYLKPNETISIEGIFNPTKASNPLNKTIDYTIAWKSDYEEFIEKNMPLEQYRRTNEFRRQLVFTGVLV